MENYFWVVIVLTSLAVLVDAKQLGIRKGQLPGFTDLGPWGWFVACLLLWVVAFPLYLLRRGAYQKAIEAEKKAPRMPQSNSPNAVVTTPKKVVIGPLTLIAAALFLCVGLGLVWSNYTKQAKRRPAATAAAVVPTAQPAQRVLASDAGFSSWMAQDAFGAELERINWNGQWARAVEGRWGANGAEYRIALEPIAPGASWYWWYSQQEARFQQLDAEYRAQGHTLAYTQSYQRPDGVLIKQGIWRKLP